MKFKITVTQKDEDGEPITNTYTDNYASSMEALMEAQEVFPVGAKIEVEKVEEKNDV